MSMTTLHQGHRPGRARLSVASRLVCTTTTTSAYGAWNPVTSLASVNSAKSTGEMGFSGIDRPARHLETRST